MLSNFGKNTLQAERFTLGACERGNLEERGMSAPARFVVVW
jgi:hypothetical protein